MAKDISMDPALMNDRAKEFDVVKENLDDLVKDMTTLSKNLEEEWRGEASEGFADQYESLKPSFLNMKDLVGDIAQQLRDAAAAVTGLDHEIHGKFAQK